MDKNLEKQEERSFCYDCGENIDPKSGFRLCSGCLRSLRDIETLFNVDKERTAYRPILVDRICRLCNTTVTKSKYGACLNCTPDALSKIWNKRHEGHRLSPEEREFYYAMGIPNLGAMRLHAQKVRS